MLVFPSLAFLVLLSRRPASILHADFWAEDGWRWYPDAYDHGWRSLLDPYAGYLQSVCRLVGLAAQPFPLAWAPTIFAVSAIALQIGAATLLVSSRLDDAWPHRGSRMLFACLYLLLPNSFEVYANLTNAQWHLSLIGFLLLASTPAATVTGRVAGLVMLALSGLSGPFCLFLLPVALWQALHGHERRHGHGRGQGADSVRKLALVAACCSMQLIVATGSGRGAAPCLGAGPRRLAAIVALQIVLGTEAGRHAMNGFIHTRLWQDNAIPLLVSACAALLAGMALLAGSTLLRLFMLYAGMVFGAGLLRPASGSTLPAWPLFATPDVGDRYYLLPMLAWIGVLFTLAASRRIALRGIGIGLIALIVLAVPGDLHFATRLATSPPTGFAERARMFVNARPGQPMQFPLRPEGVPPMILIRR